MSNAKPKPAGITKRADAFVQHPELRDRIADLRRACFRDFGMDLPIKQFSQMDLCCRGASSDPRRESTRAETPADHRGAGS